MTMQQTIGLEAGSYRRGIVLGLTMAETMILLVFCLLLAAASVFERESTELKNAQQFLKDEIGEDWRKLVEDKGAPEQSREADVLREKLIAALPYMKAIMDLQAHGVTPTDLQDSLAIASAVKDALRDAEVTTKDPAQIAELIKAGAQAQATSSTVDNSGTNPWPPIITLNAAEGHFFETGSARLPPEFRAYLTGKVMDQLLENLKKLKRDDVNVIEVIGHTDEQPIFGQTSNLDKGLLSVLQGRSTVDGLIPADNAGLGLARAVSVAGVLSQDKRLSGYTILPYSGAQVIDLGDKLSDGRSPGDKEQRRRIEIRLRGTGEQQLVTASTPPTTSPTEKSDTLISGHASVIDGDTIEIDGKRIRLWGIDAIESHQTCQLDGRPWRCAQLITFGLSAHLKGQDIICSPRDQDRYGRIVATCTTQGVDLGSWIVRQGLALDYTYYSKGAYRTEQLEAQAAKRGVWRGTFEMPWDWRHSRAQAPTPVQ